MASCSYAAAATSSSATAKSSNSTNESKANDQNNNVTPEQKKQRLPARPVSPSQVPKTGAKEKNVYVLTLLTDKAHHVRMTNLRNQYFPKHINKLAAHLTLFHALPGSVLEDAIIPVIQDVASKTNQWEITAAKPFRLKHGIAIAVPQEAGGGRAKQIRTQLQRPWKEAGFLSQQDAGGDRLHYTIMNKMDDDAKVDEAFDEVMKRFRADEGVVEGLGLYLYDRGWWRWVRRFDFQPRT